MGRGGGSSVKSGKISHRFSTALSSALYEWMLLFMLFIDAIVSYLIKKFAHKCELRTPCLLCSRLDHALGKEKRKFYLDLVCDSHKLEISSLVYCHAHNKLVDVHGMCGSCLFSFATLDKSNAETYRLLVGKLGEDFDCDLVEDLSLENLSTIRQCSCCNEPWKPKGYVKASLQTRSTVFPDAEFDLPLPVSVEHGHDDQKRSSSVPPVSVQATHQRKNGSDPLSDVAYTELKVSSDSEVTNDACGEEDARIIQTHPLQRDLVDHHVQPESQIFASSDDYASEKFMDPVSARKPSILISLAETNIIEPLGTTPIESTDLIGHGLEELNWEQASCKIIESSVSSKFISLDDVPLSSKDREASIDVPIELNLDSLDKDSPLSNPCETPFEVPDESKHISFDDVSPSNIVSSSVEESKGSSKLNFVDTSVDNETLLEVPEESKHISIDDASPSSVVSSSVEEAKERSVTVTLEVEKKYEIKCEEIRIQTEQPLSIPEAPVEENHGGNSTGIQTLNSLDLSDAYKLAVGAKGRQLSGLLVEEWIGRDSSRISGDLKVLLSQLSAQGMELLMNDASPRVAASDSSAFNGIEILQRRFSLERNESGLSIDGSIVNEIEGESMVDRLKRQVEHDMKLLSAMYKELEEERNASAVATNQAMAMITRLQEEKATLQMEALQHVRMMEEQAEYDMEALENLNNLLSEKEKEIQDLEAELEFYRMKFPYEYMSEDIIMSAYDLQTRWESTVEDSEANAIVTEKTNTGTTVGEIDQSFDDTKHEELIQQMPARDATGQEL